MAFPETLLTHEGIELTPTEEHILRAPETVEQALLRMILAFEHIHGPKTSTANEFFDDATADLDERLHTYEDDFGPRAIMDAIRQGTSIDKEARDFAEQNLSARQADVDNARTRAKEAERIAQRLGRWREVIAEMFKESEFRGTPIPPEVLEQLEQAKREPTSDERLFAQFLALTGSVIRQPAQPVLELPVAVKQSAIPGLTMEPLPSYPLYDIKATDQPEPLPVQNRLTFHNWAEVFSDDELNATNKFVINYITALSLVRNRLRAFDEAIEEVLTNAGIPEQQMQFYRNMAAIEALSVVTPTDLHTIYTHSKSINPLSRILALVYHKTFPAGPFASVDNFTQLAVQIQNGEFNPGETLEDIVITYASSLPDIVYHQASTSSIEPSVPSTEEKAELTFPTSIPRRSDTEKYRTVLTQLASWGRATLAEKLKRNYQNRPFPDGCRDGQLDLILKIPKHVRDISYGDVLRKVCPEGTQGRWRETEALLLLVLHEGRQQRTSGFDRKTVTLLEDLKKLFERDLEEQ